MMASISMAPIVVVLLVLSAQLPWGFATPSTVPAFLWSPNLDGMKEVVDYRILSPRDLAKSVMTDGRWLNDLCSREAAKQSQDFAFVFVGTELQSLDISRPTKADPALVGLLKDSYSSSNFSFAFPYIAAPEEKMSIESSLISEFSHSCEQHSEIANIALVGSCSVEGENFKRLEDIHSVHDYVHSRMEKSSTEQTDLIVMCNDQPHSEGKILSELLISVKQLGAKYTFLYVSDPFKSIQYPSDRGLERFLAEGTVGNASGNLTTGCDGLCQIRSTLLEGIFVGIVLLIILISGLCCMAGIDTPTRFETPQDS